MQAPPMKAKDNIFRYLDLSTGHVTSEDNDWLQDKAQDKDNFVSGPGFRVVGHEYGWWISVPQWKADGYTQKQFINAVTEVGLSEAFAKVLIFAGKRKCNWVYFDSDGAALDELEYFEW